MRRLATVLGVVPMALYKHVAHTDEHLDGMVDIVFGEIESPSIDGDWRSAMRRRAISAREARIRPGARPRPRRPRPQRRDGPTTTRTEVGSPSV
jgi:hypothetical protein